MFDIERTRELWLGVVADDVTGACDLAGVVRAAGLVTVVRLGAPEPGDELAPAECAVVALSTRTATRESAVAESTAAGRWLLTNGAARLYQKYCSTFDSTEAGNIGPVADALADLVGGTSAGTPATPTVGRTVYQGHLFVDSRLVSESPLRHHPLTPMTDADLVRVLGTQTDRPVNLVSWQTFGARGDAAGVTAVRDGVDRAIGHVLLDALCDDDLDVHAAALFDGDELLGGASGLAAALARRHRHARGPSGAGGNALPPVEPGGRLIVAGSCSRRTLEQVAAFRGPVVRLNVDDLAADLTATVAVAVGAVATELAADNTRPVLVTTSLGPTELARVQERHGRDRAARLAETALATVARTAVAELGTRRLIVAGGETSGAVTAALGVRQVQVGDQVAPGVPWTVSAGRPRLALLLKSGNFGLIDLFSTAWRACP